MELDFETVLKNSHDNKEINTNDNSLSGSHYVSMRDRTDTNQVHRVFLVTPARCGHRNRICVACAYMWSWDHILLLERTGGGRKLMKQLEHTGQDRDALTTGKARKPSGKFAL